MKKFGIIGGGRFGTSLAESLARQGADVILIDRDGDKVQALVDTSINAVQGDATEKKVLEDAGIRRCDVVVVCVDNLESSILASIACKEMEIKTLIAKADSDMHGKVLQRIGADVVVYPNRDRALRLARALLNDLPLDPHEIADGYVIAELSATKDLVGKTLAESELRSKYDINVLAIRRQDGDGAKAHRDTITKIANVRIGEGDILVVFGPNDKIEQLQMK